MSPAERISDALGLRQTKPGQWRGRCPCHDSVSGSSLTVWDTVDDDGDPKAGIHDFGGCTAAQILGTVNLTLAHLYAKTWIRPVLTIDARASSGRKQARRRRLIATIKHPLRDESETVLFVHVRQTFDDGTKHVWWERPDGTRGLGGTSLPDLPLYGIHELNGAAEVIVGEGETVRDALTEIGVPALGTVTGAESTPSEAVLRPLLKVPTVYLWPDNDDPGRKHMDAVGRRLVALGHPDVRMIPWSKVPPKDDAADLIAGGGTLETIQRLKADATPFSVNSTLLANDGPRLVIVRLSEVAPRAIDWVWANWLARGKVHILGGHPGDGKSTLTAWLAAMLSRGATLPDGTVAPVGGTLFLLGEDALDDTLRPRLDLHDADVARIDAIQAVTEGTAPRVFDLRKHLDLARAQLATGRYVLCVIDPLTAFMPQTDRNSEGDVRDVLTVLTALAEETDVAILAVMHVGKPNGTNRRPLQQLLGATAFGAAARLVMMVAEAPGTEDQDDGPYRRVLGVVKSNLGLKPPALEWSRSVDGPVTWHGGSDHDIAILLAGGKPAPIEAAKAFLLEALKGGSKTATELVQAAKAEGISKATLRRARESLDIVTFKQPGTNVGPWLWRLPNGTPEVPDRKDAHASLDTQVSTFQPFPCLDANLASGAGAMNPTPTSAGKMLNPNGVSSFGGEEEMLLGDNGMAGRCSIRPIQKSEHLPLASACISCGLPLSDGRRYVCGTCEVRR